MLEVTLHRSWVELEALSPEWNAVLFSSTADTFFLTWEWISAWWKNYGDGRPLFSLTVRDGKELIGIAPFYVDSVRRFGKKWTCLKLIGDGSGDSDYQDIFAAKGRERDAAEAFARFLEAHPEEWDTLELESVPETSACLAALFTAFREKSWEIATAQVPCSTLSLPHTWDSYLQSLKPRSRSKVRSSLAFLEKQMHTVPVACTAVEELDIWLPTLFELHTARWQESGKLGVFRKQAKQDFYKDISLKALEKGWLAFHRLDWGERPLAMQYGFVYRNQFLLLQEGYSPAFESLRPGQTLRAWLLRHWIETGLEEYDFLAGVAKHKLEWGAKEKMSLRVCATAKPAASLVFHSLPSAAQRTKETARKAVPEALLAWRKRKYEERARREVVASREPASGYSLKRLLKRAAIGMYSAAPIGAAGEYLATNFVLNAAGNKSGNRQIQKRTSPICQILIYHRVNDENDSFLGATPVKVFEMQMEHLARNFSVVSLDDFANGKWTDKGRKFCVAVTFDDGYRDNYLNAFPILKRLGMPATIFLATESVERSVLPWYDQVCLAFKLAMRTHLDLRSLGGPDIGMETQEARLLAMKKTLEWLWEFPTPDRRELQVEVLHALHGPESLNLPNFMLNWDEVREMSKQGINFGAHTVTHPVLSKTSPKVVREEILESKKAIEKEQRQPVRHFAYPFGRHGDFTPDIQEILREAGFETAVTTIPGFNALEDDRMELKRFTPWAQDRGTFALQMDWRRFAGFSSREVNVRGLLGREEAERAPGSLITANEARPHVG